MSILLKTRSISDINSDDTQCFNAFPFEAEGPEESEHFYIEAGCLSPDQGALPTPYSHTGNSHDIAEHLGMIQTVAFHPHPDLCHGGNWSSQIQARPNSMSLFGGTAVAQFHYGATLKLDHEIQFGGDGLHAAFEAAFCQRGHIDLVLRGTLDRTTPIWMRGSGPRFGLVGGVPLVYSTVSRLDLKLVSDGALSVTRFFTLETAETYRIEHRAGTTTSDWSRMAPEARFGSPEDARIRATARAVLIPTLQVNFYGAAGPLASFNVAGEATFTGQRAGITDSFALDTSVTVGIDSRLLNEKWKCEIPGIRVEHPALHGGAPRDREIRC